MASMTQAGSPGTIRSLIPARIDRLPWTRFHTRLVVALGVAWILDGLEITIATSLGPTLKEKAALGMSSAAVGLATGTVYLLGEVFGALFFGWLSDKFGRRRLFMVSLGVYLFGSGLTALTLGKSTLWIAFLWGCRFIAGAGIGGEYAAINSAIDELIPAKHRGRVDIAVNGTYWAGSLIGTVATIAVLNHLSTGVAWRTAFLVGPVLAVVILFVRRNLPESPRWQIMHGHEQAAEASIADIEEHVRATGAALGDVDESRALDIQPTNRYGYFTLARVLFTQMPKRSILGASLMITQSFLYNAIFFTYTLVLSTFFHVSAKSAPYYLIAFAAGNLLGPLTIGRLFDTIGRRVMISTTYILSGVLLGVTAVLFRQGSLTATTQTIAWCVIFFFASAGASAAYLTVSEIFPVEVRAQAIAIFFAIAQCFGSFGAWFYAHLIGTGKDPSQLEFGYFIGAGVMILGGLVEIVLGVSAEQKSLEDVASPLSVVRGKVAESMSGLRGAFSGTEAQAPTQATP